MSWFTRNKRPMRHQYESDEEYREALASYEDAEYWAIEEANERNYDTMRAD